MSILARAAGLVLCLCASVPLRAASRADELGLWLERAAGPDADERERAQRWLATNLRASDLERVASAAALGDVELELRLVHAIGSQPRLLELAVALALRAQPRAAELGREALREAILEWDARAEEPFAPASDWYTELRRRLDERFSVEAETWARGPEALCDLLAQTRNGAPPLVCDSRLAGAVRPAPARAHEGQLADLLLAVAAEHELVALAAGFDAGEPRGRVWICFAPRGAKSELAPLELVAGWITAVGDTARAEGVRRASARALAACGWPAALALLERRWLAGDDAAFEGVLLAAGRGAPVAALAEPERQRAFYRELRALSEKAGAPTPDSVPASAQALEAARRASAIARALAAAGPIARDGTPLAPLALEDFANAGARERWLRLCVLEDLGPSVPGALAAIDGVLVQRDAPAPLLVQALRARAALATSAPLPALGGDAAALVDWAGTPARLDELASLGRRLAPFWPAGWDALDRRGSTLAAPARGVLLELAWRAASRDAALAHGRALLADRHPAALAALRAALSALALDAPESARALVDRLAPANDEARERLCAAILLAGLAPGEAETRALEGWLAAGPANGLQALALATQAAGAHGAEVRAKLLELLGAKLPVDERVEPLLAAARTLAAAGAGADLEAFVAAGRERARTLRDLELRARLRPDRWPPPALAPVRALEAGERELERW